MPQNLLLHLPKKLSDYSSLCYVSRFKFYLTQQTVICFVLRLCNLNNKNIFLTKSHSSDNILVFTESQCRALCPLSMPETFAELQIAEVMNCNNVLILMLIPFRCILQ